MTAVQRGVPQHGQSTAFSLHILRCFSVKKEKKKDPDLTYLPLEFSLNMASGNGNPDSSVTCIVIAIPRRNFEAELRWFAAETANR